MKSAVKMSASSSDSDDDEEKIKLAQALDPDFMKNVRKPIQFLTSNGNGFTKGGDNEGPPVSKRSKLFDSSAMESEFVKPYSLDVTPEGQQFIAKQLAKSLEKSIKEKPLLTPSPCSTATEEDADSGIKLFASSKCRLTQSDLTPSSKPSQRQRLSSSSKKKKKEKHKKKKSASKSSSSSSSSDSDSEKLKSVAVSADWVLHQK